MYHQNSDFISANVAYLSVYSGYASHFIKIVDAQRLVLHSVFVQVIYSSLPNEIDMR